jgi:hypothetical protein
MKTKDHAGVSRPMFPSGEKTLSITVRRRWFALALGGFLFTSIFALSAPPVEAQCQQWNVGGQWEIRQGHTLISVALSQNGKTLSGTAVSSDPVGMMHGQVTGTIEGDSFYVQINWPNGGAGVYRGTIGPNRHLQGTTYDKNKPTSTASWEALVLFKCADAAAAPAATPLKSSASVLKGSGFVKPSSLPKSSGKVIEDPRSVKPPTTPIPQLATPTPSAEADESSSDQHPKNKKNKKHKKKHHHHDDDNDENQGND